MSRNLRTRCPLRSQVFRLTEASPVRPDSPRTSPGNETVKLSRRQTVETEWPSWTWCRTWWNYSWHSYIKSTLFCIRSSAHSSGVKILCHFANSELQRCFFGCSLSGSTERHTSRGGWSVDSWATFLFDRLYGDRVDAQRNAKTNVWFGNMAPK